MTFPLGKLIAQRVALGMTLLLAVSVVIFMGTQLLPGDVATAILGQSATPEALANLRAELGLDQPLVTRYLHWLGGILTGDLGTALSNGQDIASSLGERLGNTIFLAACAAAIAVPIAVALGILAVRFHGGLFEKSISGFVLVATALPDFFIGYVLMLVFAVNLQWFPSISNVSSGMPFSERLEAVALPALALSLGVLAHIMRMTRAAVLSVMQSPYIETAELKGIRPIKVVRRHALPNAIGPIINAIMLNLAHLIVGVVVIEVIFVYPGMGQYLVDHVVKRDMPVVQAVGLVFAAVYIFLNMVADISAIYANPRLRHPK